MRYIHSSIGKKQVVAFSGLALSLFILAHMLGNLFVFLGPETYNSYGHSLTTNPLLYLAEAGLVFIFFLHIGFAITVTVENKRSRPDPYVFSLRKVAKSPSDFAARTLIYSGLLILVFAVLHLITFKYGTHYTAIYSGVEMRDLYRLMVEVFQDPVYLVWYIFSMLILSLHLFHALASSIQSMGLYHSTYTKCIKRIGYGIAIFIPLGFMSTPIYLFFVRG